MKHVVILGAGPAGSSAGYHLASSGHTVTLIDRADFPRPKTCGDWITQGAVTALAKMGLSPKELEKEAVEHAIIDRSLLASPGGRASVVRSKVPAYCIPRTIFDDILFRRALGAGCIFRKEHLTKVPNGFRDEFDIVIDARGVYAGRPNSVAIRSYWSAARQDVEGDFATTVQLFTDDVFRMGYGWIFPVAADAERVRFNVGVGMWKEEHHKAGNKVTDYYKRFLDRNATANRLFHKAIEKTPPRGYHLAVAERTNRVAEDGVLKIGDAANLTDPLTGEGICNAVASGYLVAQAIQGSDDASEAGTAWQRLYEKTFERDFRVALLIRKLLVRTRAKNLATWALERRPRLAETFHGSLSGISSYSDLLSPRSWL